MEGEPLRVTPSPAAVLRSFLLSLVAIAMSVSSVLAASVTLTWTAVGDDSLTGTAFAYDLRYNTVPITNENYASSTKFLSMPLPLPSGTRQSVNVPGLLVNTTYYFVLKVSDERGNWSPMSNLAVRTPIPIVGAEDGVTLHFSTPFPNPSRERASFTFGLPRESDVSVDAFDVTGRHVRTLMSGHHAAGENTLVWDLRDDQNHALTPGVYLVRARLAGQTYVRRVIVQR
jgi:hypothetical protein